MSKSTQRGKKSVNQKSVTKCQQTMFTKKSIAGLKAERWLKSLYPNEDHHWDLHILLLFCWPVYLVNQLQADLEPALQPQISFLQIQDTAL